MTRDEYNKKVQTVQEVWPESAMRFVRVGEESRFEVYFDRWITLGTQYRPFQPDATYVWDDLAEIKAMARFSAGITSDRILGR